MTSSTRMRTTRRTRLAFDNCCAIAAGLSLVIDLKIRNPRHGEEVRLGSVCRRRRLQRPRGTLWRNRRNPLGNVDFLQSPHGRAVGPPYTLAIGGAPLPSPFDPARPPWTTTINSTN